MTGPVLIAVAGSEPETFWRAVLDLLPPDAHVELLHVIDEGPRAELELQFLRRPGHRPARPIPDERSRQAEAAGAQGILTRAGASLGRAAASTVRTGRPEREIVQRAAEVGAAVVIVAARPRPGPTPPEPKSVGHVARFVLDHAPCPVLLVRLG